MFELKSQLDSKVLTTNIPNNPDRLELQIFLDFLTKNYCLTDREERLFTKEELQKHHEIETNKSNGLLHIHESVEAFLLIAGSMDYTITHENNNEIIIKLQAGDFIIIDSFTPHFLKMDTTQDINMISFFQPYHLKYNDNPLKQDIKEYLTKNLNITYREIFEKILVTKENVTDIYNILNQHGEVLKRKSYEEFREEYLTNMLKDEQENIKFSPLDNTMESSELCIHKEADENDKKENE